MHQPPRSQVSLPASVLACACVLWSFISIGQAFIPINDPIHRPVSETWSDTVLVAFENSFSMGTLYPVSKKKKSTPQVDGVVPIDLSGILRSSAQGAPSTPVKVLKLNVIHLSQHASYAHCGLNIEVLERTNGMHYRTFEHGSEVTSPLFREADLSEYGDCVRLGIYEPLEAYDAAVANGTTTSVFVPTNELLTQSPLTLDLAPVLGAVRTRKGIYRTFMDMRHDDPEPAEISLRELARSDGDDRIVRLKWVPGFNADSIWGFSDGSSVFKRVGKDFVRLDRRYGRFCADLPLKPAYDAEDLVMVSAASVLFGLFGGVLVGAAVTNPSILPLQLDMRTGAFLPRPPDPRDDHAIHIFQFRRYGRTIDAVVVSSEPQLSVVLAKEQWVTFKPVPGTDPVEVQIKPEHGDAVTITIDPRSDRSEVYSISENKHGILKVDRLNRNMAISTIDRLSRVHEVHDLRSVVPQ